MVTASARLQMSLRNTEGVAAAPIVILGVLSTQQLRQRRDLIRSTYGAKVADSGQMRLRFVLSVNSTADGALQAEHRQHGDLHYVRGVDERMFYTARCSNG